MSSIELLRTSCAELFVQKVLCTHLAELLSRVLLAGVADTCQESSQEISQSYLIKNSLKR